MTFEQLKRKAQQHELAIRKYKRGEDSYMLVDVNSYAVVAPAPMTLEQVADWLNDLEENNA